MKGAPGKEVKRGSERPVLRACSRGWPRVSKGHWTRSQHDGKDAATTTAGEPTFQAERRASTKAQGQKKATRVEGTPRSHTVALGEPGDADGEAGRVRPGPAALQALDCIPSAVVKS